MRRWRRRLGFLLLLLLVLPPLTVVGAMLAYRVVQPPITPLQLIRLVEGHGFTRELRPLDQISPHLARAVIASEDNFFCQHRGVDWAAFETEWQRWRRGERPRGASTITMQLTKNLFLWPRRDHARKALELAITPVVEALLSKERILEIYLNQVEFDSGVYGAQAAARHHFDKDADRLTPREAAVLAALLPAPLSWRPEDRRVQRQADRILQRIPQLGPLLHCAPRP
ncbi:MAG: monofunctional biosynthetic peptidoglycan transglycosylase [Geminicoccaceae bacterium]|nr:MAG: monofunctional biosynthetic peptidoglycan transglycosylase [Geminicoccaceae bacterium]